MTVAVWSPTTHRHEPKGEVWVGVTTPGTEVPARVDVILDALAAADVETVEASPYDDSAILQVHEPAMVEHLRTAHADWMASGIPNEVGQDRVVPYFFATAGMLDGLPGRPPVAAQARAGRFCYDTMTLVGPGTWEAAKAATDCALTAVDLLLDGRRSVYALCRPPGHHATRSAFGGSCYLNNAAVAAQALRHRGHDRVAVVDLDAHHGNGTAAIFYDRPDVFYGSVHVDPGAGWFPHVVGFADEAGDGAGLGSTMNMPLAPGSGDKEWLAAVDRIAAAVSSYQPNVLVVSLGVDAAAEDPESPLRVSAQGYHRAGELLAALGLPGVHVQEGGYHLDSLGGLVTAFLHGFGG